MNEPINEKVSVIFSYDRMTGKIMPQKMRWQGRVYSFNSLSYYHKRKVGRVMLHIFDVTDGSTDFRLICNPENLHWSLEEISNGTGS